MKRLILILAVLFGVMTASARDNYSHDVSILPDSAQTALSQNFKAGVSHIKIGKEFGQIRKYGVALTDGTVISFDKHGAWREVEVGHSAEVPSGLIPAPITKFVKENQGKARITGIEKKAYGYEVELSNGVDARFSVKGKFLSYDD